MKTKYPEFRKLTVVLLVVTILNALLAVIALPNMVVGTPARRTAVKVMNLSDTWKKNGMELPEISNLVIDFGKAYEVSANNYVKVPINAVLEQLLEQFTVVYWVQKAGVQPATWNYMVAGGSLKWAVILNADQRVYVYSANPAWSNRLITNEILPEEWTHITMIYDVDNAVEVYFNGVLVGEGPQPALSP